MVGASAIFYLPYEADKVKASLKHIAAQMFANGICYHNFFIDQPGNRGVEASDDPLWLPNAVIKYCKETGDFAFLDEVVDYADVKEGKPGVCGSILEHCCKALDAVYADCSPRHLPYMKDCDWNDDLNEKRVNGEPRRTMESVMVAQQLVKANRDLADLMRASNKMVSSAATYVDRADKVLGAINTYCMDKKGYYKRAIAVDGSEDLGTSDATFGKVYLEPQAFAILCGVASDAQAKAAIDAVQQQLDTDFGAMICAPVYTDLAERNILPKKTWNVEKEPPAMKENGSIIMHLNAWLVQAYSILGRGKDAVDCYLKTLPENMSANPDSYRCEPYVYPEYVRGKGGEEHGRGGHTWLTGTAPTMHQAVIEYIFGLQADFDGLVVDPCVDPSWKDFAITRNFRGATYEISVKNPSGVEKGVKSVTVDGTAIAGNKLPAIGDGKVHQVVVVMG